jgi:LPS sulfotransferase NodH
VKGQEKRNLEQGVVRAVILTTQRTGSTFLMECLASHPEIHCAGEILNGQPDSPIPPPRGPFRHFVKFARIARTGAWLPAFRLEQFYGRGRSRVRCFKAMYNHLARPFVLRYLLTHSEIRVIHLSRQNLLKAYVSTLLMQKRRILQATTPVAPMWIRVNPHKAIAFVRKARTRYERYEALFAQHARLPVTYESLFDRTLLRAATGWRICDFLGVSRHPMQSGIVKLNPESLRDMVTNYDELAEAVTHSEFAEMLIAEE